MFDVTECDFWGKCREAGLSTVMIVDLCRRALGKE